jgi:hypothetical protein
MKGLEKWVMQAARERVIRLPGTPYIVGASDAATIFSVGQSVAIQIGKSTIAIKKS